MPHLVEPLKDKSLPEAIRAIAEAHDYIVKQTEESLSNLGKLKSRWGIDAKRLAIELDCDDRPSLIGKHFEKLGEILNILATIERLLAALNHFSSTEGYSSTVLKECHPSTSDDAGNDIVLADDQGKIMVRCEVCDIASSRAGSNGKEVKDLASLGCTRGVPDDGAERYICTSEEFANALTSEHREWHTKPYRYKTLPLCDEAHTCLLRLLPRGSRIEAKNEDKDL